VDILWKNQYATDYGQIEAKTPVVPHTNFFEDAVEIFRLADFLVGVLLESRDKWRDSGDYPFGII